LRFAFGRRNLALSNRGEYRPRCAALATANPKPARKPASALARFGPGGGSDRPSRARRLGSSALAGTEDRDLAQGAGVAHRRRGGRRDGTFSRSGRAVLGPLSGDSSRKER